MLVMLPVVLLLWDYWPLGRYQPAVSPDSLPRGTRPSFRKGEVSLAARLEKTPLFAVAAAVGCGTLWVQRQFAVPLHVVPLVYRVAHAAIAYVAYLAV